MMILAAVVLVVVYLGVILAFCRLLGFNNLDSDEETKSSAKSLDS